jgi:hypothetical protein
MCAQSLRCLKSKYLLILSAQCTLIVVRTLYFGKLGRPTDLFRQARLSGDFRMQNSLVSAIFFRLAGSLRHGS